MPGVTRAGDEASLRDVIVQAGRRLGRRGLIAAAEGNVSIRLADGRLLVTPAGRRKDELDAADLIATSLEDPGSSRARPGAPRPTSDLAIHRAIYTARPDVFAVVHAHVPSAMALTVAGEIPDPAALPETGLLLPRLPFVGFAAPGSPELARRIAEALAEPPEPRPGAALLERHGAIAVGATVDEALERIELVDVLCRVWRDALLIRHSRTSSGS